MHLAENRPNILETPGVDQKTEKTIVQTVQEYLKNSAFVDRKLTDTPTDSLSVVNRRYVTLNGTTANRPLSSVIGQSYFDTSLAAGRGKPVWYGPSGWVDATGTLV